MHCHLDVRPPQLGLCHGVRGGEWARILVDPPSTAAGLPRLLEKIKKKKK